MTRPLTRIAFLPAALLLAACGNTKVTLELTDAPPALETIEHVFITLERVEVHVAGGDEDDDEGQKESADHGNRAGWRNVVPPTSTFDLMALRNDVRAALGELELPSGKLTQIRLFIARDGKNEVVLIDGDVCPLQLDQVPTTGFKINHPFKAIDLQDSSKVNLVVDFDLTESVDQSGPCSFRLKPVIKLKHVEKD